MGDPFEAISGLDNSLESDKIWLARQHNACNLFQSPRFPIHHFRSHIWLKYTIFPGCQAKKGTYCR